MAAESQTTAKYGPFTKGVNNVDRSLEIDELLNAVNIDIDRNGLVSRRKGYTQVISTPASQTHSLWARDRTTAFYVDGAQLKRVNSQVDGSLVGASVGNPDLIPFRPVSFLEVNGTVYFSNGVQNGKVAPSEAREEWAPERPSTVPILTAIAGAMPAGIYRVSWTFVDASGEESGAVDPISITLAAPGSIRVTGFPPIAAAYPTLAALRLYVSPVNGEVLYKHADLPASGNTQFDISASTTPGKQLNTLHLDRMIPMEMLEHYNGRIYGVSGRVVWFTEALRYGLHNPQRNFLLFNHDIAIVKAVVDGLFIATTERTYFYAGAGPDQFTPRIVLPYGAIKGTGITFPKTEQASGRRSADAGVVVGWFSERGFVKGMAGGAVQLGDKERIMLGMYGEGAAMYRETDGIRQVIGTMRRQSSSGLVSRDFAEAEVRRHTPVTA
jgi:hypothetical protein